MAMSANDQKQDIFIGVLLFFFAIGIYTLIHIERAESAKRRQLNQTGPNNETQANDSDSDDDDPIIRPPRPVFRPLQRARHSIHPRQPSWRPTTIRSTRPRPYLPSFVEERRNIALNTRGDTPSLPVYPSGVVVG